MAKTLHKLTTYISSKQSLRQFPFHVYMANGKNLITFGKKKKKTIQIQETQNFLASFFPFADR